MIRNSLLSAAALGLAFSSPVYAQIAGPADMDQVREQLGKAEIENARDFGGKLIRALTENGASVVILVSPRDLGSGAEAAMTEEEIRQRLEAAGFTAIETVEEAEVVAGNLNEETAVIVMRADDIGEPRVTGTIPPPTPATLPGQAPGPTPGAPGTPGTGTPGAIPPPGGTVETTPATQPRPVPQ